MLTIRNWNPSTPAKASIIRIRLPRFFEPDKELIPDTNITNKEPDVIPLTILDNAPRLLPNILFSSPDRSISSFLRASESCLPSSVFPDMVWLSTSISPVFPTATLVSVLPSAAVPTLSEEYILTKLSKLELCNPKNTAIRLTITNIM